MRVGLVIPPSGFLLDDRVFPSLGVLRVAAVLEEAGVDVGVLDLSGHRGGIAATAARWARGIDPSGACGVTATMPQMPAAASIARAVRAARPDARLILGGPHATLLCASARLEAERGAPGRATTALGELHELFDVLVAGDGEHAVFDALRPGAPRLVDADAPDSPLYLQPTDLDALPLPARHLIDMASYRYAIEGAKTASLIGQLGCPFGCAFCGGRRSPFLRRVRLRSPASVVGEVRHLYERYGATGFMFLDDELNVNRALPDLLRGLIALQAELGVAFKLRGLVKAELVTDAQAALMREAGMRQILVGFESGDPRILANIQKRATVEDNTRCVETLRRHGIRVKALMSIGHAGETGATVTATQNWLLAAAPDDFDVTIITVYPGTPYYDDAVEARPRVWTYTAPKTCDRLHQGPVDHLRDVNFYKGVPGNYRSYVWTDHLTPDDLVGLRDTVEAEVRARLGLPYPTAPAERQYEHSMGCR